MIWRPLPDLQSRRAMAAWSTLLPSNVKPEVHHVPVPNQVLLPFQSHLSRFFRALLAFADDVVSVADDFAANEAALEVGGDHSRRLRPGPPHHPAPAIHSLRPA